jgi:hypothetical protein
MKMWIVIAALFCLAAVPAFADVSNEVVVGWEGDSVDEAKDNTGADVTDKIENDNALFVVQYTHFFSPLKDDGKPIELRRFYQHPSTLSAGLAFFGSEGKDSTTLPADTTETNASVLMLGGELYLPTNTGLFLSIGAGSGTTKETFGGIAQPDTDHEIGQFGLGVRQYIGESFALHVRLDTESRRDKPSGLATTEDDKAVVFLGGRGVIADVIGLALELGGGEREVKGGGSTTKYDVGAVNLEIAGYIGKHLTIRLGIEAEEEDLQGMPSGIEHVTTTGRTTLAARYWFSERFGMELPLYSEKEEVKTVFPGGESKSETTNTGLGLYAFFRF